MLINLARKRNQAKTDTHSHAAVKSMAWMIFVILSLILSGCGNKGDLYIPEKDDPETKDSTAGVKPSKP